MTHRKFRLFVLMLFSCLVGYAVPSLEGQIVEMHGDPGSPDSYVCALSGLKGMGSDCGTKYDEMVLTAKILSIMPAPNDELRLTLRPETVFKGTPTKSMEILTAQHRCLPEMKIGDSWLFSLYRDEKSKELIVNYGSRSGPETEESQQISFLRRLASLDAAGVVKGRAYSYQVAEDGVREQIPSMNHTIILTRVEDGQKFKALTDKNGEFEFEPVPAGKTRTPNLVSGPRGRADSNSIRRGAPRSISISTLMAKLPEDSYFPPEWTRRNGKLKSRPSTIPRLFRLRLGPTTPGDLFSTA